MNIYGQLPMIDINEEEQVFNIYHDESGTYKKDRWFIVGLLLVPLKEELNVVKALNEVREKFGYSGEIHFSALPKSWQGEFSAKALIAHRWLKLFQECISQSCYFYALAVDTHSRSFDTRLFPRRHFAYNRFTRMALVSAISWQLRNVHKLAFQIYSDEKCRGIRCSEMSQLVSTSWDNFEQYLPKAVVEDIKSREALSNRSYPSIRTLGNVLTIDSSGSISTLDNVAKTELIQFTDLLLGATAQAIVAGSSCSTKRDLGMMVSSWIEDTRKEPWKQQFNLHRRFSVTYFPDNNGNAYSNGELAIMSKGVSRQLQFKLS